MAITDHTRKVLWARSGARCAVPSCRRKVVAEGVPPDRDTIVGEEAHIYAQSTAGPRGERSDAPVDRDSYDNLVLVCRNCHRVIDDQREYYTPERLKDLKQAHEAWVDTWLETHRNLAPAADAADLAGFCESTTPVHVWRGIETTLLVCTWESHPVNLGGGRWRGSGLAFHAISPTSGTEVVLLMTSADPHSEYWLNDQQLHVMRYTFNPDEDGLSPLVEYVFDLFHYPPAETRILRLRTKTTPRDLPGLMEILATPERSAANAQRVEIALFQLRNVGMFVPSEIRALIRSHQTSWWWDGAISESAQSILHELDIIETAHRVAV